MTADQNRPGGNEVTEWVLVTDPVEGAFSVQMPRGWQNQASSVRPHGQYRSVISSRNPGGDTILFMGGSDLPSFVEPSAPTAFLAGGNPLSLVHTYLPADQFLPRFVQQRYGQAPGFRITGAGPNPVLEHLTRETAQKKGIQARISAARVTFEYQEYGATVRGVIHGTTLGMGDIWVPDISGILTTGDPAPYGSILFEMVRSYQTNPQWRQQQDNAHAQAMTGIQQESQSRMAAMQAGHEARMNAIHQAGAVNTQIHQGRMAQSEAAHQSFMQNLRSTPTTASSGGYADATEVYSDASHRRALNYIRDEETVVDSSGQTYRVETGYERYYLNLRDNTYIGADSLTERDDLRKWGVNPEDYEEVRIRR